jgi:sphingosine kinase
LHTLTIDFAEEKSKHKLTVTKLSFERPPPTIFPSLLQVRGFIATLMSRAYGQAVPRKRAYVLVNPHAGPGGADKKFAREVRPIFEAARMPLTVVTTTHTGHAVTLCKEMDIDAHDVVVACSGDGLPHECFNGLAERPDAKRALGKMPVVLIPCGSGNAMACNLYGTHKPSLSALAIVKGVRTPLDLVSITQGDRRFISFLSQAFGLVADLDLGTEHLRWMGSTRFTVGFMWLVFQKRQYPCDIAVKVEIGDKLAVKEHYQTRTGSAVDAEGAGAGSAAQQSDKGTDVAGAVTPAMNDDGDDGLPPLRYGTVTDKIPEGWDLIPAEKMGNFYCGNVSCSSRYSQVDNQHADFSQMAYMAPDANFFAGAMPNDGLMDMVTADGDISPLKAIQMQLGVENGHFFDNPLVNYQKVSAYRLTPRDQDKNAYISIDGEAVPFEPFQAEVHQGLGLTLSKNGNYEAPGPKDWDHVTNAERLLA